MNAARKHPAHGGHRVRPTGGTASGCVALDDTNSGETARRPDYPVGDAPHLNSGRMTAVGTARTRPRDSIRVARTCTRRSIRGPRRSIREATRIQVRRSADRIIQSATRLT